jgi:hypothetical protein
MTDDPAASPSVPDAPRPAPVAPPGDAPPLAADTPARPRAQLAMRSGRSRSYSFLTTE